MEITIKDIKEEVARASHEWTYADWAHEQIAPCSHCDHDTHTPCPGCKTVRDEDADGDPVMCEGLNEGCQYCEDVEASAREAIAEGANVIACLLSDDIDGALESANRARALEQQWGDCPTWEPVRELVEEYAAER